MFSDFVFNGFINMIHIRYVNFSQKLDEIESLKWIHVFYTIKVFIQMIY